MAKNELILGNLEIFFFWHLKNLSQMSQNMSIEIFKMFLKQHEDIVMHKLCGSLFCTENQKANLTVVLLIFF